MRLGVPMELYPGRALERVMKVQEVILRAIGGQISWMQVAETWGIRIGRCGGDECGTSFLGTTGFLIAG